MDGRDRGCVVALGLLETFSRMDDYIKGSRSCSELPARSDASTTTRTSHSLTPPLIDAQPDMIRTTIIALIAFAVRVTESEYSGPPVWDPPPDNNRTTMGCTPFTVADQPVTDLSDALGGALCTDPRTNQGLDVLWKADQRLNLDFTMDEITAATYKLQPIDCPPTCGEKKRATASGGCWRFAGQQTVPWTPPGGGDPVYKVAFFEAIVLIFHRGDKFNEFPALCSATCLGFDTLHC